LNLEVINEEMRRRVYLHIMDAVNYDVYNEGNLEV